MGEIQVVTGAGPVGWTVAERLADEGRRVRVLTRSGSGPERDGVERLRVDVSDPVALADAVRGAGAVFHCVHGSAYAASVWRAELPRAEAAVLEAAGREGAAVVFPESLYSYTDTTRPMTEDDPRTRSTGKGAVRRDLLAARAASPTPTVSVVASDFVGPRVRTSHMGDRVVPAVLTGRKVRVLGSLDQPHSWTHVPDLARAMVVAARREDLWNTVLHAPTDAPRTQREMVHGFAAAAGTQVPEPGVVPAWLVRSGGLVSRELRELAEMLYQFDAPFVMDSAASQDRLGFGPTPVEEVWAQAVAWWREESVSAG
ncbi:NAD-dependent epimerase/dehydratase family protein [Marmoricola endophyticus]|nr:NAD-dependent epimerase/dehydratase family protein [Marmoricola endophyticus]